jgi:oligosaccharide repeat unit polymerase
MLNPFYMYMFSNIFVLVFFSFQWSNYYQNLSVELFSFLIINTLISGFIGFFLKKKLRFRAVYKKLPNPKILFLLIYFGYFVNLLYARELPIINVLFNIGSYYKDIENIPSFYPILTALNIFYFVYLFSIYISFKDKKYFYMSLLLLLPLIANMGRGLLVMALIPAVLIFLAHRKSFFSFRGVIKVFTGVVIFTIIFGYLGDIRSVSMAEHRLKNIDVNELILSLGDATNEFRESHIPDSFFWIYLYTVSPVSNLNNIIQHDSLNSNFSEFFVYNFAPQSLQKIFLGKLEKDKSNLVVDTFNVSTMYALPYTQLGWLGIALFQIIFYILFFILFLILHNSDYKVIFLSFFSSVMLLSGFANMLVLDVIFIPISLCVLLALANIVKKNRKTVTRMAAT